MNNQDDLPIFVKWMDFLKWLLSAIEKFPKSARFSFSNRIANLALDVAEHLIEARYSKNKSEHIRRANLNIEKLRVLLRISYESKYLPYKAYEQSMYSLNEVGRMLGGWGKQQGVYREAPRASL